MQLALRRVRALDSALAEDEALAAVTQFDLLSAMIISEKTPDVFYPNAAEFPATFPESFVISSLRDRSSPVRQHVFHGDDEGLRNALRDFDWKARLQAALARFTGQPWEWRGFDDARTLVFIDTGQRPENWGVDGWV